MENDVNVKVDNLGDDVDNNVDYEALYKGLSKSLEELTAERDSLLNENKELRSSAEQAAIESHKAKEMNYTLARQLNVQQAAKRQPEEIMAAMFLKGGNA